MTFTGNHYIAQVVPEVIPRLDRESNRIELLRVSSERGSRRTSEQLQQADQLKSIRNFVQRLTQQCVVVHMCALASI